LPAPVTAPYIERVSVDPAAAILYGSHPLPARERPITRWVSFTAAPGSGSTPQRLRERLDAQFAGTGIKLLRCETAGEQSRFLISMPQVLSVEVELWRIASECCRRCSQGMVSIDPEP
jgi:hypothetical protein